MSVLCTSWTGACTSILQYTARSVSSIATAFTFGPSCHVGIHTYKINNWRLDDKGCYRCLFQFPCLFESSVWGKNSNNGSHQVEDKAWSSEMKLWGSGRRSRCLSDMVIQFMPASMLFSTWDCFFFVGFVPSIGPGFLSCDIMLLE